LDTGNSITKNESVEVDSVSHTDEGSQLAPDFDSWFEDVIAFAEKTNASDVHLVAGQMAHYRIEGEIQTCDLHPLPIAEGRIAEVVDKLLNPLAKKVFENKGSFDGVFTADADKRFRFNVFRTQNRLAIALRRLSNRFLELAELGLKDSLYEVCELKDGLVLVAGPTGSGKTTTLATLIHHINKNRRGHIITIEDPVEFVHRSEKSLVSQRQIGFDTPNFQQALVDAVRQDPDVILVGEIRDLDTIRTAITAAETGHLVFATVHAGDCVSAIDRLISVFPGDEQATIRHLLASSLRYVVAQHLVAGFDNPNRIVNSQKDSKKRVLISEALKVNQAVSNLVSSSALSQIRSVMETSGSDGMYTLDGCLARLLRKRVISEGTAKSLARNPDLIIELARRM